MCGIAGVWELSGAGNRSSIERLANAARSLSHRGPDGASVSLHAGGVGLAHTRLAIIDLSPAGAQPMHSADGRLSIVFNGEIYNYREIREELSAEGVAFRTASDTEVVLNAYARWGEACAERFIGMFAFAIWDSLASTLILFRDRVGVKPLYYARLGQDLYFASELKAMRHLLADRPVGVSLQAVGEFLQYGYIRAPQSIYDGVRKLSPASWLRVSRDGATERCYWRPATADISLPREPEAVLDALQERIEDAVRYRLVADVPIALFLSGGVDSSLIGSIASQKCAARLTAFTIAFPQAKLDESLDARRTASFLGLPHHVAEMTEADIDAVIDQWSDIYDEPFEDLSGVPAHFVSRLAGANYKVVLSGDGGDELFGGYTGYQKLPERIREILSYPGWQKKPARALFQNLTASPFLDISREAAVPLAGVGGGWVYDRAHRAFSMLAAPDAASLHNRFQSRWQPHEISRLLDIDYSDASSQWEPQSHLATEMSAVDFARYLPDDVLVKMDRASMANGIEAREPLLDHRLVEFALSLPPSLRFGAMESKPLLRKLLARYLPREMCYRPKRGFSVPIQQWIRRWIAKGRWARSSAVGWSAMSDLIDPRVFAAAYSNFRGSAVAVNRLWLLLVLDMWAEAWRAPPPRPRAVTVTVEDRTGSNSSSGPG